jgi:hypothetical protein
LRLGAALATTFAGAALLYGCGEEDETSEPVASTNLVIELDPDGPGGKPAQSTQVLCEDGMDTSPCPQLAELAASDLAPVSPQTACTEIFGGPDVVTITGTLATEAVDAKLTRANGCEIDRFDKFVPVLEELYPGYKPGQALQP